MKKLVLNLTMVLLILIGFSKSSSGQLVLCNPSQCTPNPCFKIEFINNTTCVFDWGSFFPGCSEHPGFHVAVWTSGPCLTCSPPCASCDPTPCSCPTSIKLVDPSGGWIEDWGNLASWTTTETVYDNIPYSDCECTGNYQIKITIKLDPIIPNFATITIDCS